MNEKVEKINVNGKTITLTKDDFIALFESDTYRDLMCEAMIKKYERMAKNVMIYVNNDLWEYEGQIMFDPDDINEINKVITNCFTNKEDIKKIY